MQYEELRARTQALTRDIHDLTLSTSDEETERVARVLDGLVRLIWDQATGDVPWGAPDSPVQPQNSGEGVAQAAVGGPVDTFNVDTGLDKLRAAVDRYGRRAFRNLDYHTLKGVRYQLAAVVSLLDNGEIVDPDALRILTGNTDQLLEGLREIKQDLNKLPWWQLYNPPLKNSDQTRVVCADCGCCVGTYQALNASWLCPECADHGECPRQLATRQVEIDPYVEKVMSAVRQTVADQLHDATVQALLHNRNRSRKEASGDDN